MLIALCLSLPLLAPRPQEPNPATLLKQLQSSEGSVRIEACNTVEQTPITDQRVIKAILSAKEYPTPTESVLQSVGYHAGRALVACGPAAAPVLIKGLGDRQLRGRAAGALGTIRPIDQNTLPALRKCLDQNKSDTAGSCDLVVAIGALGAEGRAAVPDLLALVTSKRLRNAALGGGVEGVFYGDVIWTFGLIGPDAASAIPDLLTLTAIDQGIGSPMIRRLAAKALGQIGFGPSDDKTSAAPAPGILESLRRCRNDEDPSVVTEANTASALLDPDYPATVDARKDGLQHRDLRVRAQTCALLGAMGTEARSAKAALAKVALKDSEESVRRAAAAALKQIDG